MTDKKKFHLASDFGCGGLCYVESVRKEKLAKESILSDNVEWGSKNL